MIEKKQTKFDEISTMLPKNAYSSQNIEDKDFKRYSIKQFQNLKQGCVNILRLHS